MKLKIGDKIYIKNRSKITGWQKIIKITKTMAKSKDYNFDTSASESGYCKIKGLGAWSILSGYIATPELDKEFEDTKKINWFDNEKFTDEQKIIIYNLFNKKTNARHHT